LKGWQALRRPRGLTLASLGLAGLALAALTRLMMLRFEAGDLYPPYSSLRPDPLGTAALYDALQAGPMQLSRLYLPLRELPAPGDTTLLYMGLDWQDVFFFDAEERRQIEALAASGGRVLIGLLPTDRELWWQRFKAQQQSDDEQNGRPAPKKSGHAADDWKSAWETDWNLKPGFLPLPRSPGGRFEPATAVCSPSPCPEGLPAQLPWHSAIFFEASSPWSTLYTRDGKSVAVQKRVGRGSIVVMSDSFALSNEGLKNARQAGLVAWLCAQRGRLVFDERHLGVADREGVAGLALKLGLMPMAALLALLALLALWRLSAPLLPPRPLPAQEGGAAEAGMGSGASLASLLRRHQSPREIFRRAWDEFRVSSAARGLDPQRLARAAREAEAALRQGRCGALKQAWGRIAAIVKRH
jgi:hypothetical protein